MLTTCFLIWGIFFPRFTLLLTYLFSEIPSNTVPFAVDVIGSIFVPRFLIAFYIFGQQGYSPWFFLYIVVGLIELLSTRVKVTRSES